MTQDVSNRDALPHEQRRARRPWGQTERLRRRPDEGRIAGLAAGVAHFVDANPTVVRGIFVATIPLSLGVTVLGYLLLWLLIPGERST